MQTNQVMSIDKETLFLRIKKKSKNLVNYFLKLK